LSWHVEVKLSLLALFNGLFRILLLVLLVGWRFLLLVSLLVLGLVLLLGKSSDLGHSSLFSRSHDSFLRFFKTTFIILVFDARGAVEIGEFLSDIRELLGRGHLVPLLVNPLGGARFVLNIRLTILARVSVNTSSAVNQFVARSLIRTIVSIGVIFVFSVFNVVLRQLNCVDFGVVKGLASVFVLQTEPGDVVVTFLGDGYFTDIIRANSQQDHSALVLELTQGELDFPVVIDFHSLVTEVLTICEGRESVFKARRVGADGCQDLSITGDHVALGVVLGDIGLEEGVVSDSERESLQGVKLKLLVRVSSKSNRVCFIIFKRFVLKLINERIKLFMLLFLEFFQSTVHKLNKLPCERRDLDGLQGVENEVNTSGVGTFDGASLFSFGLLLCHCLPNSLLLASDLDNLFVNDAVDEGTHLGVLLSVNKHFRVELVLVGNFELIFETVAPVRMLGKVLQSSLKAALEEVFGNVEALELVHGLDLLLSLDARRVERLVLLLDARHFAFDLLLPAVVLVFLSLLILGFEFADLVELCLFLDLKQGLLDGLSQENVQNGLHFAVIVKQVVVLDLSDLVDAGFLGDVLRLLGFLNEVVSLSFDLRFFGCFTTLFGQEVRQVDFDSGGRQGSQLVGRLLLLFVVFVLDEGLLDHLHLLFLSLHLDALLFLLCRRQVGLEEVEVMGVSAEDTLVVHDVEGVTILVFTRISILVTVLVLLFSFNDLRLGAFESLGHFLI